jgi:hypothetical protein
MESMMRETWKGMILGALLGALVGLALEALRAVSSGASRAAHEAGSHAPGVAQSAVEFADRASQKLRDSDFAEQAATVAKRVGEQVKTSAEDARRAVPGDERP